MTLQKPCCRLQVDGDLIITAKTEVLQSDAEPVVVRSAVRDISGGSPEEQGKAGAMSGITAVLLAVCNADEPRQIGGQWQALLQRLPNSSQRK